LAFLLKTLQVFIISIITRLITLSLEEFCPTPCSQYTTYNNKYNKSKEEVEEEKDSQRGVYVVQNNSMVGQNKKTLLRDEKVAIRTQEVFNQPMNTQQYVVPLNTWTGQGMYFVQIINPQGQIVDIKKIILQ
jgi:hypothetical protein